ncbi:MAG: S41 family peptidase [Syntrophomonadaceae bacterium]|nr:S41 family peptidase [Syntrophomonadaceae bacterium]
MRSYQKNIAIFWLSVAFVFILLLGPAQAAVLDDVRAIINANYVDPVDETVLQAGSVEEILEKLNDPHSVFFTPEEYQAFLDSIGDSTFSGIGVQIESAPEGVLIVNVLPGSSAEGSNIKPGDIIISVDGKSLQGMSSEQVVSLIRGPENSHITMNIKRGNSKFSLSILRQTVVLPSVRTNLLAGNIGYIDIDSFGLETIREFRQGIEELHSKGAKAYIIDLRNNVGGYLVTARDIAGYFIGSENALITQSRNNKSASVPAYEQRHTISEPTVFLVNEFSASASEILAAAVKDHDKALVIGHNTYGKGSMQRIFQLRSGEGFLKLTTNRFFSPDGNAIEGKGITPDLIIQENDPIKAAQLLLSGNEKSQRIILRIGRLNYSVDTQTASTPAYWSAYGEIIEQLPDYTLYRWSEESEWQVADPQQLKDIYPFYFPSYKNLAYLEPVPEDKQFILTFSQALEKKSFNKDSLELIDVNSGETIALDFLFLGSRQLLLIPQTQLEKGNTYWLLIHPEVELSGQGKLDAGRVTTIRVENTESLEVIKVL